MMPDRYILISYLLKGLYCWELTKRTKNLKNLSRSLYKYFWNKFKKAGKFAGLLILKKIVNTKQDLTS